MKGSRAIAFHAGGLLAGKVFADAGKPGNRSSFRGFLSGYLKLKPGLRTLDKFS